MILEEMLKEFSKNGPYEQEQITEGHQIIDLANRPEDFERKKKKCCGKEAN